MKPCRGELPCEEGHEKTVLSSSPPHSPEAEAPLDASLGKARYFMTRYNFVAASDVLNLAITTHPHFLPALIEKMRVELAFQDWDAAVGTAHR